ELADAHLHLALLLLGGVVTAVLAEVALLAGRPDALGYRRAALAGELVVLGLQPVVGLLGQPRVAHGGTPRGLLGRVRRAGAGALVAPRSRGSSVGGAPRGERSRLPRSGDAGVHDSDHSPAPGAHVDGPPDLRARGREGYIERADDRRGPVLPLDPA